MKPLKAGCLLSVSLARWLGGCVRFIDHTIVIRTMIGTYKMTVDESIVIRTRSEGIL